VVSGMYFNVVGRHPVLDAASIRATMGLQQPP
jgi:hypothetical protein